MSDFGSSPAKEIEIDADGEDEGLLKKSTSPELVEPRVISRRSEDRTKGNEAHGDRRQGKKQRHKSPSTSASCSKSSGSSRSRSRSRDYKTKRRLSRSSSGSSQQEHKRSTSGHIHNRSNCRKEGEYDRHTNNRPSHYNSRNGSPVARRKQGFGDRENPAPNRCIGVFGLSLYTQERVLWEVFGRYGHINEVQVVYDRQTGRSRGFGFIYFKSTDGAFEAKQCCDGMEIDGRKIRVDFSITEGPHPPTPGVYLGRSTETFYSSRYCADRRPAPYQRCGPSYSYGYRRSYSPDRKYY